MRKKKRPAPAKKRRQSAVNPDPGVHDELPLPPMWFQILRVDRHGRAIGQTLAGWVLAATPEDAVAWVTANMPHERRPEAASWESAALFPSGTVTNRNDRLVFNVVDRERPADRPYIPVPEELRFVTEAAVAADALKPARGWTIDDYMRARLAWHKAHLDQADVARRGMDSERGTQREMFNPHVHRSGMG